MEIIENKMAKSLHGSWVVDPMYELSWFVYNKSHVILHEDILPQLNGANYFVVAAAISDFTNIF